MAGPISISTSPRCHKGGGLLLFKRPVKQEAFIPYSATLRQLRDRVVCRDKDKDAKRSLRTILRIIQLHLTCKHSSLTHLHQEQNRRCSDFFPIRNYLIADSWPDTENLERSTDR